MLIGVGAGSRTYGQAQLKLVGHSRPSLAQITTGLRSSSRLVGPAPVETSGASVAVIDTCGWEGRRRGWAARACLAASGVFGNFSISDVCC